MKLKWKGNRNIISAGVRVSPGEVVEFPEFTARQLLADENWVRFYEPKTKEKRTRSAGGDGE